ncbi:oxygenase MpaB family protein [uncultured Pseudokineococcus sp.]|uniref:oxygenase MpaB family protein n=1 Tax=uncultured Pseudokineococcus sp. TaxID=1642928 RepID=UPI00260D6C77|nr:oxygenase MpaB family protein [uncultured Pseudokineococcus sp.]
MRPAARPTPAEAAGDPGLFGPDSVTWRVHADPVAGIAGLRALLLQALHPLAMAGVDQHSRFRADPWGRLTTTAEFVATTTFGPTDEALALAARVRGVHRRVRGVDPETGGSYAASDTDLLRWVHCCLVDSFLSTAQRAGAPLTPADADEYVREQVRAAELVGVPAADAPSSRAELQDALEGYRPVLRSSAASREVVGRVVAPPMPLLLALATPAAPLWASTAGLALATLPSWALRLHGVPRPLLLAPAADAATTAALRALRAGVGGLQRAVPVLREPPSLRQARERLAGAGEAARERTQEDRSASHR